MVCRGHPNRWVYFCFFCKAMRNTGHGDHQCHKCPFHVTLNAIDDFLGQKQTNKTNSATSSSTKRSRAAGAGSAGSSKSTTNDSGAALATQTRNQKRQKLLDKGNDNDTAIDLT